MVLGILNWDEFDIGPGQIDNADRPWAAFQAAQRSGVDDPHAMDDLVPAFVCVAVEDPFVAAGLDQFHYLPVDMAVGCRHGNAVQHASEHRPGKIFLVQLRDPPLDRAAGVVHIPRQVDQLETIEMGNQIKIGQVTAVDHGMNMSFTKYRQRCDQV